MAKSCTNISYSAREYISQKSVYEHKIYTDKFLRSYLQSNHNKNISHA